MTNELIEHSIVVDEYITATIKIPKQLTAMEFKALATKANKLFSLAEVQIVDTNVSPIINVPKETKGIEKRARRKITPEQRKQVKLLLKQGKKTSVIVNNLNKTADPLFTYASVSGLIARIKKGCKK